MSSNAVVMVTVYGHGHAKKIPNTPCHRPLSLACWSAYISSPTCLDGLGEALDLDGRPRPPQECLGVLALEAEGLAAVLDGRVELAECHLGGGPVAVEEGVHRARFRVQPERLAIERHRRVVLAWEERKRKQGATHETANEAGKRKREERRREGIKGREQRRTGGEAESQPKWAAGLVHFHTPFYSIWIMG